MDLEIKDKQIVLVWKLFKKTYELTRQTQNINTIQCSHDLGVIPNYHQDFIILCGEWCGLSVEEGLK